METIRDVTVVLLLLWIGVFAFYAVIAVLAYGRERFRRPGRRGRRRGWPPHAGSDAAGV